MKNSFKKNNSQYLSYFLIFIELINCSGFYTFSFNRSNNSQFYTSNYTVSLNENSKNKYGDQAIENKLKQVKKVSKIATQLPTVSATSDEGQNEFSGYSVNSSDELVDKFTGDFKYSIPLANVDGYPINLNYNSAINMSTEASWVGLGWDLNVGSINRDKSGIPDDFNGDDKMTSIFKRKVEKVTDLSKYGGFLGIGYDIGKSKAKEPNKYFVNYTPQLQVTYLTGSYESNIFGKSNVDDFGLQASFNTSLKKTTPSGPETKAALGFSYDFGYSSDSKHGIGYENSFGFSGEFNPGKFNSSANIGFGTTFHSRSGRISANKSFSAGLGKKFDSKIKGVSVGYSSGSSLPFGSVKFTPNFKYNLDYKSFQLMETGYFSLEASKFNLSTGVIFQQSETLPISNETIFEFSAFGYMHSSKAIGGNLLMDFYRPFDNEFSTTMKNIPISMQSYDQFSMNAHMLSGQFRANRTDYGNYHDAQIVNDNNGPVVGINAGVSVETSPTPATWIGVGGSGGKSTQSGVTEQFSSDGTDYFKDNSSNISSLDFDESVYFKAIGEKTPNDMGPWDALGGAIPNSYKLDNDLDKTDHLTNSSQIVAPSNLTKNKPIRSTHIKVYTAKDASFLSNHYKYKFLTAKDNVPSNNTYSNINNSQPFNRIENGLRKQNHISAIEVVTTEGNQYIYGLPIYSKTESDVIFSVGKSDEDASIGKLPIDPNTGLVKYYQNDVSILNSRGMDALFSWNITPSYANTFLLTSMYSSDYVDKSNDGPTIDDVGNYYKFEYAQAYDATNSFNWRYPISGGPNNTDKKAFNDQGLIGTDFDDKGMYSYGEKEIWYVKSVRGKTLVAVFNLKNRNDGFGVVDHFGSLDITKPLKCLDNIKIYNIDVFNGDTRLEDAIPLQTITFEYDYSLCKKTPSNKNTYNGNAAESGKLTLKKIRVFNGDSTKDALNVYEFNYDGANPDFSYRNMDAWSGYKLDPSVANPAFLNNNIHPYVNQTDVTFLNTNSSAWKISSLSTPTGGKIKVDYEADRYTSVQDQKVMAFKEVLGFMKVSQLSSNNVNLSSITNNFADYNTSDNSPNEILVFKLSEPISTSTASTIYEANKLMRKKYLTDNNKLLSKLFLRLFVNVNESGSIQEFLNLFVQFNDSGVLPILSSQNTYEYGYIKINNIDLDNEGYEDGDIDIMNSIQYNAANFIRRSLPDLVYGSCKTCTVDPLLDEGARDNLFNGDRINLYDKMINNRKYVRSIVPSKSYVKLYIPTTVKYASTARVKKITYTDNWEQATGSYTTNNQLIPGTGEATSEYEWTYQYTIKSGLEDVESGVVQVEPNNIIDEMPSYNWNTYENINEGFINDLEYMVTPIALPWMGSASVGYENVKVIFKNNTSKGYAETHFLTCKDPRFKVKEKSTTLDFKEDKSGAFSLIFSPFNHTYYGVQQGYLIETNDFHGRVDEEKLFNGYGILQSRTKYNYFEIGEKVNVIDEKGKVTSELIAVDYDMHEDTRKSTNLSNIWNIGLTVYFTFPPRFKFAPTFMLRKFDQQFYSHCLVKHINYSAILKSIETEKQGSVNSEENLLFDRNSGEVIVSSLKDEFNDKLYSVNYPSYWYEKSLKNKNNVFDNYYTVNISTNGLALTNNTTDLTTIFTPGDQFVLNINNNNQLITILSVTSTHAKLITANGNPYTTPFSGLIKLAESGYENRLSESMQNVVTKEKLAIDPNTTFNFPKTNIINSSAVEYTNKMATKCGLSAASSPFQNAQINPFNYGLLGTRIINKTYEWQSERVNQQHAHGIRFDGTLSEYKPFYALNSSSGKWFKINEVGHVNYSSTSPYSLWRTYENATYFNENGKLVESKDALDVFQAVLYGYDKINGKVPVASASNSTVQQIAFDGFEDYKNLGGLLNIGVVNNSHFDFSDAIISHSSNVSITTEQRHSGFASLQVNANKYVSTSKLLSPYLNPDQPAITSNYPIQTCQCTPNFNPTPGKYILSAWIKGDGKIDVKLLNPSTSTTTSISSTKILTIDGWNKIEVIFDVLPYYSKIEVVLNNSSISQASYFDDLRIHPFLAEMTTVVYNPVTFQPIATHDSNNMTTFYNYDGRYVLNRIRLETIEGIKTIKEISSGNIKRY
jgi:hypothetical protein